VFFEIPSLLGAPNIELENLFYIRMLYKWKKTIDGVLLAGILTQLCGSKPISFT